MSTKNDKVTNKVVSMLIMLLGAWVIVVLGGPVPASAAESPMRLWMAGAGALGLVSGFASGLSEGHGKEFVAFIGAGIVVPILGGVGALLTTTQEVTENSTYSDTLLVGKTTRTVTSLSDGSIHPLAVLGSFFVVFGLFAALGIIAGALLNQGGTFGKLYFSGPKPDRG